MNKNIFFSLLVVLLAGCQTYTTTPAVPGGEDPAVIFIASTPSATQVPSATPDLYQEVHVSQTAVALESTRLAQQAQEISAQQAAVNIQLTIDAATSTAYAAVEQTAAAYSNATRTAIAFVPVLETAGASTQIAATKTAQIETQEYYAEVTTIWVGKIFLVLLALIVIVGLAWAMIVTVRGWYFKLAQMKHDHNGRLNAVAQAAIPGGKLVNPNLAHRAVVGAETDDLTPEQAMQNAAHARQLEGIRAIAQSAPMRRQLTKAVTSPTPEASSPELNDWGLASKLELPLPEWGMWMQNWKPGRLALGINEKGLLQADPEMNPHFLFAGTTGSWKTRGGARVLVTCALANGWQVIIAGKKLDYQVFEKHPNAHLLPYSMLTEPTKAVDLLRNVYGEIERRDRILSGGGHSLWSQTGQMRTIVVIDEFSNLADALEDIDKSKREELWRWARMDTAEARKYGIHMVYLLQDPTAKSIDLRIRRNTTAVVFRVKDADSSRTVLNASGAELLPDRHFLAGMVKLERGAAFAPSDEDINGFLDAHPVQELEPPSWIDGQVMDQTADRRPQTAVGSDQPVEARIRQVLERMQNESHVSLSQAQREVFGVDDPRGGAHFRQVQQIWIEMQAGSDTDTGKDARIEPILSSDTGITTGNA